MFQMIGLGKQYHNAYIAAEQVKTIAKLSDEDVVTLITKDGDRLNYKFKYDICALVKILCYRINSGTEVVDFEELISELTELTELSDKLNRGEPNA